MASPQSINARNNLGSLLDDFPRRGNRLAIQISSLAAEIGALQTEITNNGPPNGLYEAGDIGLLNQVRSDIKSALQQAASAI